jgi:hypothetical protein
MAAEDATQPLGDLRCGGVEPVGAGAVGEEQQPGGDGLSYRPLPAGLTPNDDDEDDG